jgi:hypothetical protein
MKKIIIYFLLFVCLTTSMRVEGKQLILTNSMDRICADQSFVLTRNQLHPASLSLFPLIEDSIGHQIPCQVDDLNADGRWDELAFVCSFRPHERKSLRIVWVTKKDYPQFMKRTHVHFGKANALGIVQSLTTATYGKYNLPRGGDSKHPYPYQTDGPSWENDKMAFRQYFDGRNVRDLFGKRTEKMVMDSVGINSRGKVKYNYAKLGWWGMDILSCVRSTGLGGISLLKGDSLIRLGVGPEKRTDNIDSTRYKLISDGVVRSIFEFSYKGWEVDGMKIDVDETITIWAGKYGYENKVKLSKVPAGSYLVTGIVDDLNTMPTIQEKVGNYQLMMTFDKQTCDKLNDLGMGLAIDQANWTGKLFEAPKEGMGITNCWCTAMKPDKQGVYRYNCYASWNLADKRFAEKSYFVNLIKEYAEEMTHPISVTIR